MENRIIKFRAYDKTREEYLSAGHIFLQINAGRNPADCVQYLDLLNNPNAYAYRFVIEQFTGMLDKNGKEIYEGDIVSNKKGTIDVITYDSLAFALCVAYATSPNGVCATFFGDNNPLKDLEVIGNIHDNPSLISDK